MMNGLGSDATLNTLLALLPARERATLVQRATRVRFDRGKIFANAGVSMRDVLFVQSGVIVMAIVDVDGAMVQFATVGREGMIGAMALVGNGHSTNMRAFALTPGEALRLPGSDLRRMVGTNRRLQQVMRAYVDARLNETLQAIICNRLHSVEQRASRWLLQTAVRAGTAELEVTQELLAQLLGVRRASISIVAERLRRSGIIEYRRGLVTIVDRTGLRSRSCHCYYVTEADLRSLAGDGIFDESLTLQA